MIVHLRPFVRLALLLPLVLAALAIAALHLPLRLFSMRAHLVALSPHQLVFMRLLCALLGIRIERTGQVARGSRAQIILSNHQSYLDIPILGACLPGHFVSKAGVRRWPLLGLLATVGGTFYVNRTKPKKRKEQLDQIGQALRRGARVIAFPEGTTSDGTGMLPFRTGLFQAAIDTSTSILPVSVEYRRRDGSPLAESERLSKAWVGDAPIGPHMLGVLKSQGMCAIVRVGPPITPPFGDRRALAQETQRIVEELYAGRARERTAITVPASEE